MSIVAFDLSAWTETPSTTLQQQVIEALENGAVVYLPNLSFNLTDLEQIFYSPDLCDERNKNVSYDLSVDTLGGFSQNIKNVAALKALMQRYAQHSRQLLRNLFPQYDQHVIHARTSYRPVEIAGRPAPSYRKDDTLLHVDAFPSTPTQGKRILRVFSNVNPVAQPRVWRVGEAFANVVQRFTPQVHKPIYGSARIQQLLRITRDYRTLYDHYMLKIHHQMKADQHYQQNVSQQGLKLQPGSTWFVYTDQVSHAAMAGQYVLEQTFYLPVHGMQDPSTSPLRVLEKTLNHALI